jgi:hypothetical protein
MKEQGPFIEAMQREIDARVRAIRREWTREFLRDLRGLPPLEQELGWRVIFREGETRD